MTTTYGKLGYCFRVRGFLECRPFALAIEIAARLDRVQESPLDDRLIQMHLVACQTPQGPLEDAPMSALLGTEVDAGDRWDAFWSSDAYMVRCIRADGAIEWFTVGDEVSTTAVERSGRRAPTTTRVIEFPLRQLRTRVVVAKGPDGRGMLVGTARRFNRKVRRAGE